MFHKFLENHADTLEAISFYSVSMNRTAFGPGATGIDEGDDDYSVTWHTSLDLISEMPRLKYVRLPVLSQWDHVQGAGVFGDLKHQEMVGLVVSMVAEEKGVSVQMRQAILEGKLIPLHDAQEYTWYATWWFPKAP
jgi:hypothetical protein